MNNKPPFCEQWLWNRAPLGMVVTAACVVSVLLTALLYPRDGQEAFYYLAIAGGGIVFWFLLRFVGKRLEGLQSRLETEPGETTQCLMVNGAIQSPGVAHLGEGALFLAPIFGKMVTVDLEEVDTVRECGWFNGTLLICKRGFWFEIPGRKRLGVALPKSVAVRWRKRLVAGS